MKLQWSLYLLLILSFLSCKEEKEKDTFQLSLPNHFTKPLIPLDNELTQSRVNLGRILFFDRLLSKDSTVSCASCHLPNYAFSDTVALSKGVKNQLGKHCPFLLFEHQQYRLQNHHRS